MALTIVNGDLTGTDGAVYTWADVVAAAGASITLVDGIYFCDITIKISAATLNIVNQAIVFKQPISTGDNSIGRINFGEKLINENGEKYALNGCDISFASAQNAMGGYFETTAAFNATGPLFNLYGCNVRFLDGASNTFIGVSEALQCAFLENAQVGSQKAVIYIQPGAQHVDCLYSQIKSLNFLAASDLIGPVFSGCRLNVLARAPGEVITVRGMQSNQSTINDFFVKPDTVGTGFRFIDSDIDLTKCSLNNDTDLRFKAVSVNIKLSDELGPVNDALVNLYSLSPQAPAVTDFSRESAADGSVAEIIADIESAVNQTPAVTASHHNYRLEINSYRHVYINPFIGLFTKIGQSPDAPETRVLQLDPNITLTEAETIALTAINTASEAYHRHKAEFRATEAAIPSMSIQGKQLNTSGMPVTLDPNANQAFSFSGFGYTFKTNRFIGGISGDVTLMNGATIENGDYGKVILDSGFTGNVTFVDITVSEIVNNTTENIVTNLLNSTTAPAPYLEAQ